MIHRRSAESPFTAALSTSVAKTGVGILATAGTILRRATGGLRKRGTGRGGSRADRRRGREGSGENIPDVADIGLVADLIPDTQGSLPEHDTSELSGVLVTVEVDQLLGLRGLEIGVLIRRSAIFVCGLNMN